MATRFGEAPSTRDIRRSYLDFFKGKGHEVVESASLVPSNDPSLMFTAAGMVQFKDVFLGKDVRSYTRATSSQKCIRISGKHNDLENVGVTARHHTFFEMLGNFSFGDYFKEEAISYSWELLTKVWGIPEERLVITVFGGEQDIAADDEARAIWKRVTGVADERIIGMGMADNFWQMADTGPCGPCTEIHYFHGDNPDVSTFGQEPNAQGHGWMEIWNLVFMQFVRSLEGDKAILTPLPKPCVDTGAGLERVASVLQGKSSNYDTDVLRALVDRAAEISKKTYRGTLADDDVSMRVIADHARTTAFLLSEGIMPDRAAREYVLRRVMRRAIRHGHRLGIQKPFLHEVALHVVDLMGADYPELTRAKDLIASVTEQEEVRFRETIDRGLKLLDEEIARLRNNGKTELSGEVAFKLYDTFGFPLDLTEVIAKERDLTLDVAGYDKALEAQRSRSEGSKVGDAAIDDVWREVLTTAGETRFTGYDREDGKSKLVVLVKDGKIVEKAAAGDAVSFVTTETPFYAESGGQVGDRGVAKTATAILDVETTDRPIAGLTVHHARVREGEVQTGEELVLTVDNATRQATRRNHSATHLLHWALRTVLGPTATQKGSLVGPDRLRFDFSHGKPVTEDELRRIEDLVNDKILQNAPVMTEVLPIETARSRGAVAMFGEKYGDVVRVLTMTSDSVEFCGGTHARALGDIGLFKILSEGGVAAGVRRIEAATGKNSIAFLRDLEQTVSSAAKALKANPSDLVEKTTRMAEHAKALEKEVADLKRKVALGGGGAGGGGNAIDDKLAEAREIAGAKVLATEFPGLDVATLREVAEQLRDKLGSAVVLVGTVQGEKAQLVLTVSKDLTARFKAGDLIRGVAQIIGGSGGGRPDMAQAGGTQTDKLKEALAHLYTMLG